MTLSHDADDSSARRARLREYVESSLLRGDQFLCSSYAADCRPSAERQGSAFVEAEMPHVGEFYSLRRANGGALRVVVLGQERGRGRPLVSMTQRTMEVQAKRDFSLRNPHLKGTVYALAVIFGADPSRTEHVDVDGRLQHVIDLFTLTNATLCSALARRPDGTLTTKGQASPTMRRRCNTHLRAQLAILEPTVLLVQGRVALDAVNTITRGRLAAPAVEVATFGETQCRVVALAHPTSHAPTNWPSHKTEYFRTVVTPLLSG